MTFYLIKDYLYLIKRGITKEMVEYFDIRFSTTFERIIFPVYYQKQLVGFQARLIDDSKISEKNPKARSLPFDIFKKSNFLFNYDKAFNEDMVAIVEGPIDACKAIHFNPVALFGKSTSETQLKLIKKMPNLNKIYIALDPEEDKARAKLYHELSYFYDCRMIDLPKGTDCGDKSPTELIPYFSHSKQFDHLQMIEQKIS